MELFGFLIPAVLIALCVYALIRLLTAPICLAMKLLFNTLLGFGALWLIQIVSPITGISLGINVLNAAIIGILGLPGLVLLVLVQWIL